MIIIIISLEVMQDCVVSVSRALKGHLKMSQHFSIILYWMEEEFYLIEAEKDCTNVCMIRHRRF